MLLGTRLQQLRKEHGLSRVELGAMLEWHEKSIASIENSRYNLKTSKLDALAKLYNMTPDEILEGVENRGAITDDTTNRWVEVPTKTLPKKKLQCAKPIFQIKPDIIEPVTVAPQDDTALRVDLRRANMLLEQALAGMTSLSAIRAHLRVTQEWGDA